MPPGEDFPDAEGGPGGPVVRTAVDLVVHRIEHRFGGARRHHDAVAVGVRRDVIERLPGVPAIPGIADAVYLDGHPDVPAVDRIDGDAQDAGRARIRAGGSDRDGTLFPPPPAILRTE